MNLEPLGGPDVDPVEVVETRAADVLDRHPLAARLIRVLPPLRAEVRPELLFGPAEVDKPRSWRRTPALSVHPAAASSPINGCEVSTSGSISTWTMR